MAGKFRSNKHTILYKKCERIRPGVISEIGFIPEYMEAIQKLIDTGGIISDGTVFQTICDAYKELYNKNGGYKKARDVINKVSRDLYGDPHAWQYK